MIFKLKTSKKTQEIFEEIGKSTAFVALQKNKKQIENRTEK